MTWTLKSVIRTQPQTVEITFADTQEGKEVRTKTLRHHRTAFTGRLQTPTEWGDNIKREIVAWLAELNESDKLPPEDITADFA